jgi:hypothetical protein
VPCKEVFSRFLVSIQVHGFLDSAVLVSVCILGQLILHLSSFPWLSNFSLNTHFVSTDFFSRWELVDLFINFVFFKLFEFRLDFLLPELFVFSSEGFFHSEPIILCNKDLFVVSFSSSLALI